jgi:hypothetical protein
MRFQWALPMIVLALLAISSLPASACIPGQPEVEFEAQAVKAGTAFLEPYNLSLSTFDELFPQSISFKDNLYTVWQREDFNGSVKYFVTLKSFDGNRWTEPLYISSPDMTTPVRSELNLNPRMGASEDALYVVWTCNEPNWTSGTDDDVVFRFTEDGETWSEPIEVTGHYNNGLDKLARVIYLKGLMWFLWETNDPLDSDGSDMDIVMRSWDGNNFGPVVSVSKPGDIYNDHHVQVAADDENMYIMWMKKNYTSGTNIHDVWGRVFDGVDFVTPSFKLNSDEVADHEHPTVVASDDRGFFIWESHDTGKLGDPTSIVMRQWTTEGGLGRLATVSSLTSNGKDSKPSGVWCRDQLFITWVSSDQGITFGEDADLVFRTGSLDEDGIVRFDDIIEVSPSTDESNDRFPSMVVYDDVVNVVWIVDSNYTYILPPLNISQGELLRSPDVVIQSVDIPFEKQLGLVYTLGTAFPIATKPTNAQVSVSDLNDDPIEHLRVGLLIQRVDGSDRARFQFLNDVGDGEYKMKELEFSEDASYDIKIIVNDVEAGAFVVDVVPPPPSFMDRFPATIVFFIVMGVVCGFFLYRMMGRDEMVEELRPIPLGRPAVDEIG